MVEVRIMLLTALSLGMFTGLAEAQDDKSFIGPWSDSFSQRDSLMVSSNGFHPDSAWGQNDCPRFNMPIMRHNGSTIDKMPIMRPPKDIKFNMPVMGKCTKWNDNKGKWHK